MDTFVTNSSTTFLTALSDLYMACKENRLEDVQRLLQITSLTDINRIEPHGSTALHAATFYNHEEIVKLLLDKGALRTIRNNYNYTPYEEAKTPYIKRLFERLSDTKRFGGFSGSIEWNVIDPIAAKSVNEYKETEKKWFTDVCGNNETFYLEEIERYVRKQHGDVDRIDEIHLLIDMAIKERNISHILKAYTLQTGFYHALNIQLASNNTITFKENDSKSQDDYFQYWHGSGGYAAFIVHHPIFQPYTFTGTSYRRMLLLDTDINVYKVNTFVINKAFLSTSMNRQIAKQFAKPSSKGNQNVGKYSTICTYKIRNRGSAFNISMISEYPNEEEVLIMPRTAFRVASFEKKRSTTLQLKIEIELHECHPEKFVDRSIGIDRADAYY